MMMVGLIVMAVVAMVMVVVAEAAWMMVVVVVQGWLISDEDLLYSKCNV